MDELVENICLTVGGMTPLTTIDFPEQLSAVIYCQGCPWRCRYCHNPHLIPAEPEENILNRSYDWAECVDFLKQRRGLLDAVVFSGGEPLKQTDLKKAMDYVKDLGFQIGLHTGGAYPRRLESVLPLVDWVGFDVKQGFYQYDAITQVAASGYKALESLKILLASGVDFECRTTVHPDIIDKNQLMDLAKYLAALGVQNYAIQRLQDDVCFDHSLENMFRKNFLVSWLEAEVGKYFSSFVVR